jgi:cytochrome c-type biogenesis protein CcmH/NrfG
MSRSEWSESEIVLKDLLEDHTLDTEALDKLFLEAVDHEPLRRTAWKLLGDHYMRTGRPQAATDAYLHASNTVDEPQL